MLRPNPKISPKMGTSRNSKQRHCVYNKIAFTLP
jgi:hypothetical protein